MGQLFIGLSGYSYRPWQGEGRFYPPGLKQAEFLPFYAQRYRAVEMDGSWYRTPSVEAVAGWIGCSPNDFHFSFKLHRRITHIARLKPESFEEVGFICKRLAPMASADKLGPFLIQLPPSLKKDEERLEAFVDILPKTFAGVEGYDGPADRASRWAVEFRHPTWNTESVSEILAAKGVGWVASDTDELPAVKRDTADFHYVRLRRTEFSQEDLDAWASYFAAQRDKGRDLFIYCKHEDEGSPWDWADYLLAKLA